MGVMGRYLTADQKKLQNRGVKSVPSRVINLKALAPDITIESLEAALFKAFAKIYGYKPAILDEKMMDQPTITQADRAVRQAPDGSSPGRCPTPSRWRNASRGAGSPCTCWWKTA